MIYDIHHGMKQGNIIDGNIIVLSFLKAEIIWSYLINFPLELIKKLHHGFLSMLDKQLLKKTKTVKEEKTQVNQL